MEVNQTRINKFLSESGFCSRREADKLLEQGRITINGIVPELGTKVSSEDEIRVELEYFGLVDTNIATQIRGPARRGQVGAVTRVLPTSNALFASIDEAAISITPTQAEQLKRGEWYFEVQSQTLTTGELRGQIDNVQFTNSFE